jgi:hypothetical protein
MANLLERLVIHQQHDDVGRGQGHLDAGEFCAFQYESAAPAPGEARAGP